MHKLFSLCIVLFSCSCSSIVAKRIQYIIICCCLLNGLICLFQISSLCFTYIMRIILCCAHSFIPSNSGHFKLHSIFPFQLRDELVSNTTIIDTRHIWKFERKFYYKYSSHNINLNTEHIVHCPLPSTIHVEIGVKNG